MKIAVPKEAAPETRVPVVPDSVKRLLAKKIEVTLEAGAGQGARFPDADYAAAGATVGSSFATLLAGADLLLRLRSPSLAEVAQLREGMALVAPLLPLFNLELIRALAARRITAISVDMIPRTTLAQMMDVLSSQATAAGYEAVLLAASASPRFFPMLMTAAGSIAPARVLILGAGVAGLSAVGTARRLGAVVEVFDVRAVVKEQVESLGAKFVVVEGMADAQAAGGYARDQTAGELQKQAEAIARHVKTADVIICTALIPGRRAPVLVTEAMVNTMKAGSVIVDLAAEQQGNCALTVPGETVQRHGVTIVGRLNLAGLLPVHASQMYSRNMEKLLLHLSKDGALRIDLADEISAGCVITHAGEVVNARVRERLLAAEN